MRNKRVEIAIPFLKNGINPLKLEKILGLNQKQVHTFLHYLNSKGYSVIRFQDVVRLQRPGDFDKY